MDSSTFLDSRVGCIYLITNLVNGKKYIGQHHLPVPDRRWKTHMASSKRGDRKTALHGAMHKYGLDNFICERLYVCEQSKLGYYEEFFADLLHTYVWDPSPGYNMCRCGSKSRLGMMASEETRRLLSISHMGKTRSKESLEKSSESLRLSHANNPELWAWATEITRKKLKGRSNATWGSHTPEANSKISATLVGRPKTDEHCKNVSKTRKPGETGIKFITKNDSGYYVRVDNRENGLFNRNYPTLEQAQVALNEFLENGIVDKRVTRSGHRFIRPHKDSGWIVYMKNKKYGKFSKTFPTLENAVAARDAFLAQFTPSTPSPAAHASASEARRSVHVE
jgi:group I intron endonuclease